MSYMGTVGIRELNQNASAIVARATNGERIVITDRGRPVAVMTGLQKTHLDRLIESGEAVLPVGDGRPWEREPLPQTWDGPTLTETLLASREQERY